MSLQNLINALYSRDISRKVSTALLAQQQNGTFQNRNPPYGYMWNEDKSAYVIDETAASYVRDIFRWKMEGVSVNTMIRRLEEAGAVHPELRKRQNGSRHGNQVGKGWAKSTINSILENRFIWDIRFHGRMRTAIYRVSRSIRKIRKTGSGMKIRIRQSFVRKISIRFSIFWRRPVVSGRRK